MTNGFPTDSGGPLQGIRVLELGNFVAAPTAGRLLAEFGAEVIKIELPRVGDEVRSWRLVRGDTSMMWRAMARNKKSVTVDMRTPEGAQLILRLIEHIDVVVENYRPGKLESWGLSPDALRERNPALVVVRISGYGQTGPYRDRSGFGSVAESMGGIRYVTGYEDRPPTRMDISIGDTLAGMYGVIGALMGLLARERRLTTRGETVDVALTEAVLSVMESAIPDFSAYGVVRERDGEPHHRGRAIGNVPMQGWPLGRDRRQLRQHLQAVHGGHRPGTTWPMRRASATTPGGPEGRGAEYRDRRMDLRPLDRRGDGGHDGRECAGRTDLFGRRHRRGRALQGARHVLDMAVRVERSPRVSRFPASSQARRRAGQGAVDRAGARRAYARRAGRDLLELSGHRDRSTPDRKVV